MDSMEANRSSRISQCRSVTIPATAQTVAECSESGKGAVGKNRNSP